MKRKAKKKTKETGHELRTWAARYKRALPLRRCASSRVGESLSCRKARR